MFTIVGEKILRWGTPDPEGDWIMYGYAVILDRKITLIDPPLVPDLIVNLERLGKLERLILTTLDHTRGARYLAERTGADIFVPNQVRSKSVDPEEILRQKGIKEFSKYDESSKLGFEVLRITVEGGPGDQIPWIDEFSFLTSQKELIVGDIAIGTSKGGIMLAPEWFPHVPPNERHPPTYDIFMKIIEKSGARTLLATHGSNIYGNLQEEAKLL